MLPTKLFPVLVVLLFLLSCHSVDHTAHPSYDALEQFLAQKELHQEFGIQKIAVDHFFLADAKKYGSDTLLERTLKATYTLTIQGKDRNYASTAELSSTDSLNWKMALFTMIDTLPG